MTQKTQNLVRRSAFHIVDTDSKMSTYKVPIWVYEVKQGEMFPVKFEYKAIGYKGLRFSERESRIEYK